MTDNEIIKALECCQTDECERCPLSNYDGCESLLFDGTIVLDLINRQKAEIEMLQKTQQLIEDDKNRILKAENQSLKARMSALNDTNLNVVVTF